MLLSPVEMSLGISKIALERIPKFCENIEVIFVEGNSHDNTWEEIKRVLNDKKYNKKGFKLKRI